MQYYKLNSNGKYNTVTDYNMLIIIIGVLVLSSSVTEERDNLWMVDSDLFPFQTALMESHVSLSSNSVAF